MDDGADGPPRRVGDRLHRQSQHHAAVGDDHRHRVVARAGRGSQAEAPRQAIAPGRGFDRTVDDGQRLVPAAGPCVRREHDGGRGAVRDPLHVLRLVRCSVPPRSFRTECRPCRDRRRCSCKRRCGFCCGPWRAACTSGATAQSPSCGRRGLRWPPFSQASWASSWQRRCGTGFRRYFARSSFRTVSTATSFSWPPVSSLVSLLAVQHEIDGRHRSTVVAALVVSLLVVTVISVGLAVWQQWVPDQCPPGVSQLSAPSLRGGPLGLAHATPGAPIDVGRRQLLRRRERTGSPRFARSGVRLLTPRFRRRSACCCPAALYSRRTSQPRMRWRRPSRASTTRTRAKRPVKPDEDADPWSVRLPRIRYG